jgi:hypothetical protein
MLPPLQEEEEEALVSFKTYMPLLYRKRKRRGHIFFE